MAALYLLQMMPGKTGNPLHEASGLLFAGLFVAHHMINRGWTHRLGRQRSLRAHLTLASDVALAVCVVGVALTGVLMSRTVAPWLSVPSLAHVARPLHGCFAYVGFMIVSLHIGLHMSVVRGYAGRGGRRTPASARWHAVLGATLVLGVWAFVRLDVAGKLLGHPSFPDGMTPLAIQLLTHLSLAAPFVALGTLVDGTMRKGGNAPHPQDDQRG